VATPGNYYSIDILGTPLVVTRDRHSEIRVLSRNCTHRWMEVCSGAGEANVLQCPCRSAPTPSSRRRSLTRRRGRWRLCCRYSRSAPASFTAPGCRARSRSPAQKRTRLHTDQGDRVDEAIRVGEQVATIAVRGLLKRPSEIARISAHAAQFDDASIALRVSQLQPR
jgi:hypothetical protein